MPGAPSSPNYLQRHAGANGLTSTAIEVCVREIPARGYTKDELAAFKASLSPSLKAEADARIKAVNDSFDNRGKKSAA